jgi:hypothetical protein
MGDRGSAAGIIGRVHRSILGTVIAVPLGLACLPIVLHAPILGWALAAVAMIVYALALPERLTLPAAPMLLRWS